MLGGCAKEASWEDNVCVRHERIKNVKHTNGGQKSTAGRESNESKSSNSPGL